MASDFVSEFVFGSIGHWRAETQPEHVSIGFSYELDFERHVYGNPALYCSRAISTDLDLLKDQAERHRARGKTLRIVESPLLILSANESIFGIWSANWGPVNAHFERVLEREEEKRNQPLERHQLRKLAYFKSDRAKASSIWSKPHKILHQAHHIKGKLVWLPESFGNTFEIEQATQVAETIRTLIGSKRNIF